MRLYFFAFLFPILFACKEKGQDENNKNRSEKKEDMILMNQQMMRDESAEINEYIKANKLDMIKSGTGLRYHIVPGTGAPVQISSHSRISISYNLSELDGTPLYSYSKEKPFTFASGRGEIPRGMEEAIMQMKPGDKAKLIIPTHLAYGKTGDDKKIGPGFILVCELEFLNIENQ